jgi:hypothetical protein
VGCTHHTQQSSLGHSAIRRRLSWRSRACSHYEIRPGGPPWWGLEAMPAPPGHRCDQTSLPARSQGATCTGQPAGCSRYTAVTLNKPLDFERGGQFFRAIILHAVTRNYRWPAGRRGPACSHADLRTENSGSCLFHNVTDSQAISAGTSDCVLCVWLWVPGDLEVHPAG